MNQFRGLYHNLWGSYFHSSLLTAPKGLGQVSLVAWFLLGEFSPLPEPRLGSSPWAAVKTMLGQSFCFHLFSWLVLAYLTLKHLDVWLLQNKAVFCRRSHLTSDPALRAALRYRRHPLGISGACCLQLIPLLLLHRDLHDPPIAVNLEVTLTVGFHDLG